jgi:hypothetical protein
MEGETVVQNLDTKGSGVQRKRYSGGKPVIRRLPELSECHDSGQEIRHTVLRAKLDGPCRKLGRCSPQVHEKHKYFFVVVRAVFFLVTTSRP